MFQSGADSLSGDRLGGFNLSIRGHAECLTFLKQFNLPLLVLGGGGYTIRNVARCWAYETGVVLDMELDDELPFNDYLEYFGPDYRLHFTPNNMENQNGREYLEKCKYVVEVVVEEWRGDVCVSSFACRSVIRGGWCNVLSVACCVPIAYVLPAYRLRVACVPIFTLVQEQNTRKPTSSAERPRCGHARRTARRNGLQRRLGGRRSGF